MENKNLLMFILAAGVSIMAVVFLNGSVFGVFNYMADYLSLVSGIAPIVISGLMLAYGLCNIGGSMLTGNLLTVRPLQLVKVFPFVVAVLYFIMLGGGSAWPCMGAVMILWGILAGINANINQYWIARAAPEAPDFANGLFLTAANMGCVLGTMVGGWFINTRGMEFVVMEGILFCTVAALIIGGQCSVMRSDLCGQVQSYEALP